MPPNKSVPVLKVVLLGDGGVGKSSLMNRFISDKFDSLSFHTIGVEFLNKDINVDGENYTMQIWDTAGQERFKSLRTPFYRGSDCCLLTFSVDDLNSFKNLTMWQKEFLFYADVQNPETFPFVLLGNKVDVSESDRQVFEPMVKTWCEENNNTPYYETSAKTAVNVREAFTAAVQRILDLDHKFGIADGNEHAINLKNKPSNRQSTSCCPV